MRSRLLVATTTNLQCINLGLSFLFIFRKGNIKVITNRGCTYMTEGQAKLDSP